jgi:bifunctional DNA-binding transcriptional regulator/antitoxin component of YhaV-PrlF toxin-antitoxin module
LVIPAEYRKALDLSVGEDIVIRMEGDEIRVYSLQQAVKRAQQFAHKYMKGKGSLVDELIAERRRDAKRELDE